MNDFKIKSKLLIKRLFNKVGLQISRAPYQAAGSDELIKAKVGAYQILIPGNHQLPMYLRNSFYATNLPRLAAAVKAKYADLTMIDVGANVGDTVALVRSETYFPIVCLEGDDDFFKILKTNLENFKDVYPFQRLLGEKEAIINAVLEKSVGSAETARINDSPLAQGKKSLVLTTLDNFLETNRSFKKAKLLKIDTDGYDLKIIRGGRNYIKETKPVLFLEYDPVFLAEQKDDGISTLESLEAIGYQDAIFYDNCGKFILSADLSNRLLIKQMHNLIDKNYKTPFPFYDLVLFHRTDSDIAKKFIAAEMNLFYN